MKFPRRALGLAFCCLATAAVAQPYGLSNRVSVPTLNVPPSPPQNGYVTTNAFGNLTFTDPLVITTPPGETNRLFIVEQNGIVAVITNLAAPTRTVFLNIVDRVAGGVPSDEQGLLGMAFHPDYAANGFFYLYYTTNNATSTARHQRLSRFQVSAGNPNSASSSTEAPILTMQDDAGNHNGGDMHFGADGYLYLSLGDEGGANDTWNNSQILDKDFWAGMLRIDVDNRGTNLVPNPHPAIHAGTYRVPSDNPYVGVTSWYGSNLVPAKVRTEFYAIGLRNPWRWSFDRPTGRLYLGDVGQGTREEIDIIVKGGNYGWAFREGLIAGPKATPPGATHINPILDYQQGTGTNQGRSVTGGVVYRGSRIPALQGRYIFADYVIGNIWSLLYNGTTATEWVRIASDNSIAAFGHDPSNGDVLLADQSDDTIKRLVSVAPPASAFPATLADSGIFSNVSTLTPYPGIVGYDVNVPYWTDNAIKSRWFYFPPARTITFRATNNWTFPTGSVWIQHFELELTNGVPESRRRLETRLLVRDNAAGIYGVTYRWGGSTANATLVAEGGMDESFVVNDGGNLRTQVWRYPGRSECLVCHTPQNQGGFALGFNSPQLNRDHDYSGIVDNQLRSMVNAGYFSAAVSNLHGVRWLAPLTDESVSVEQRARSWLAANCVGCHQPFAPGGNSFDTRIFTPLIGPTTASGTRLINGTLNNNGGDTNNRVIVPGSLSNSMLLTRISTREAGQMPPLGTTLVDTQALALISRWITQELTSLQSFADWQVSHFGSTNAPTGQPNMDPDNDGATNFEEFMTGTDPNVGSDAWKLGIQRTGDAVETTYPQLINRGIEIQWTTNLFNPAWQFLNVHGNRPFISATNGIGIVPDTVTNGPPKYYRGRVFEP